MGLLIDTNVIISVERNRTDLDVALRLFGDQVVHLSAISASELLHGVHRAESAFRRGRREAFVEKILSLLPVLPMDLAVARCHARLWADQSARGQLIGAHDMIIAATALANGLTLLTANLREFERVEGLAVLRFSPQSLPGP